MSAQNILVAQYFTENKSISPSNNPYKRGLCVKPPPCHALENPIVAMPLLGSVGVFAGLRGII